MNHKILQSLIYSSIPVENLEELQQFQNGHNGFQNSGIKDTLWLSYVREMSPFYFNILSEYLYAASHAQVRMQLEDVEILHDLAQLYNI